MIRYALVCEEAHEFEAWFASSDAYDKQAAAGLVECPVCGSMKVRKQIMAPAVHVSRRRGEAAGSASEHASGEGFSAAPQAAAEKPSPPGPSELERIAAKVRAHIRQTHVYVGDKFAEEARAMHAGEKDEKPIYGEATPAEARQLREEGVPVAALPEIFAPTPPKKAN